MWAACRCLAAAECLLDDGDSVAFAWPDSPCDLVAFPSKPAVGPSTQAARLVVPCGGLVDPSEDECRDHCHSLVGVALSLACSRLCVADAA